MEDNKKFLKGALFGALVMFIIMIVGTGMVPTKGMSMMQSMRQEVQTKRKLNEIQSIIDKCYLYEDEVDMKALREGLYSGYIAALGDPYTEYYSEKAKNELLENLDGSYVGIGAAMLQDIETMEVLVSWVYEDSPAEEAGLKAGDYIVKVDDHEVGETPVEEVASWIRGEEGTKVTLHVLRGEETLALTTTRRKVDTPTVSSEMKADKIGYIAISQFDTVTLAQFETALNDLEKQGMEGLIVDLRNNPGGNLNTVTGILELLLPKGVIVTERYKDGSQEEFTATGTHEFKKPMVVLVNQNSASASEIFAGAIQDYGIGEIVGTTTFGKGVVQNIYGLSDGSAMKITTAEYLTPKGRNIHKKGVKPDVEVEYEVNPENPLADNQLEQALKVIQEKL